MTSLDYSCLVQEKIGKLRLKVFSELCDVPKIRFIKRKGLSIALNYIDKLWMQELLYVSHLMSLEREEYKKIREGSK